MCSPFQSPWLTLNIIWEVQNKLVFMLDNLYSTNWFFLSKNLAKTKKKKNIAKYLTCYIDCSKIHFSLRYVSIFNSLNQTEINNCFFSRKRNIYIYIYIYIYNWLHWLMLSTLVIIALQYSRRVFWFSFGHWLSTPWFFSRSRTRLVFSFFFTQKTFSFSAGPWFEIFLSLVPGQGFFVFFWSREYW